MTSEDFINVNPFKYLKISENENSNYDLGYYLFFYKNPHQLLSAYILDNPDNFTRSGNIFTLKNKDDPFYYTIINDINTLKKLFSENKYIIIQKDKKGRTLLHYSVVGKNYDITLFLLEQGINYDEPTIGVKGYLPHTPLYYSDDEKITELLEKFGAKNTWYNVAGFEKINSKGINIKFETENKIDEIFKQFFQREKILKVEDIKLSSGEIIAKRLLRNQQKENERETNSWNKVYHGTRLCALEHILILGLRNFGEPLHGHIPFGEKNNGIQNWARAIFVTPSIFYASKYAEIINSENEDWYVIIEAKVQPNSYSVHEKTIYNYNFKYGEPKNLEFRIRTSEDLDGKFTSDEKMIETFSVLFVKKEFLDNCNKYSDSSIFL